jgi:hypothetical protein
MILDEVQFKLVSGNYGATVSTEADIKSRNYFDLNTYFDEMIFGVRCIIPKYEYIKSLANGSG